MAATEIIISRLPSELLANNFATQLQSILKQKRGKKTKGNGKQQLALGNGGVGDGGKGAGKQKLKMKTTADQKPICFAFNNGQACKQSPCNFAHVCQLCEGPHPKTDAACPLKGK